MKNIFPEFLFWKMEKLNNIILCIFFKPILYNFNIIYFDNIFSLFKWQVIMVFLDVRNVKLRNLILIQEKCDYII